MQAASKQVGFGPIAAVRVFDPDLSCLEEESGATADGVSARPVRAGSDGPEVDHALTFDLSHCIDTLQAAEAINAAMSKRGGDVIGMEIFARSSKNEITLIGYRDGVDISPVITNSLGHAIGVKA